MNPLWDDIEGARPFEDEFELAGPHVTFNGMKEGDPWSDGRTPAPSTAAGSWPSWTPDDAPDIDDSDLL